MKLLVEAPLNSLSFGNVSLNIIREFYNRKLDIGLFPMGNIDLNSFELEQDFVSYIQSSIDKRFSFLDKEIPSFKLWHLNGSENRKNKNQYLYTFYECNQPTNTEASIAKSQEKTFFSSSYSKDIFLEKGCSNSSFIPIGFDNDFYQTEKKYLNNVIHFGLMGKFEKRKHTGRIIQAWLKKYGNNNKYQLTCCITNPFFKPEDMNNIIQNVLEGKRYTNVNFLPFLQKNKEVNDLLNSIDIDLTGLSGAEGWNLPAFNATCLGKWSIVLNATSHKDWANEKNSILVEPNGEFDCYDQVFFQKGSDFNQGTFFNWDEDSVISAMEKAESKARQINTEGQKLSVNLTYSNTVDKILSSIFENQ
jgi:hypothetical protein